MPNGRFAKALRGMREARGWSRRDLARRTGLTEKALYMIETGRSDPSNSTLIKVAEAFELAVLELLHMLTIASLPETAMRQSVTAN